MVRRILIAEDDDDQRTIIAHFLGPRGYEIVSTVDGREALEQLETPNIDLLIVDLAMPKVDGGTVIRELRERLKNQNLPVIALTAHDFGKDQERAFQAGCNEFMSKPFDPCQLLERVQKLIGTPAGKFPSNPSAI